jgi:hypothetical protein
MYSYQSFCFIFSKDEELRREYAGHKACYISLYNVLTGNIVSPDKYLAK